MKIPNLILAITVAFSLAFNGLAQNADLAIQSYLNDHSAEIGLEQSDVSEWMVTDDIPSGKSKLRHVYIAQTINGIPVKNGTANFALNSDNEVVHFGNRLIGRLSSKVSSAATPALTPEQAITAAATSVEMDGQAGSLMEKVDDHHFVFEKGTLTNEKIRVKLRYWMGSEEMKLVWIVSLYQKDGDHWWQSYIDASTGDEIERFDWVVSCQFPTSECEHEHANLGETSAFLAAPVPAGGPAVYNVFPLPIESPSHGNRSLVSGVENATASPFGWHDTNGTTGEEYTITRGNNVYAYEDVVDSDNPGFSPDGGGSLSFDFPFNGNSAASTYQSAAVTNLFYMNNMMHDTWYLYGFDEASGNFQSNNYGNGGQAGDYVLAEAQDGGGTNNANFATPTDGDNPRMQMYLWSSSSSASMPLDINSPVAIQGTYSAAGATFGPGLPTPPITADVVLVADNTTPTSDGCETLTNASQLVGKIALVDRGTCNFTVKVESAQNAGALAVIVVNNVAAAPIQMGGTSNTITIPSIMVSMADGNLIKDQLLLGAVNATIYDDGQGSDTRDGDFDNGIVAHEYGHGISTRLTGGASNSDCLQNDEQMGEGWSDWFGLMLTIENGDAGSDVRGVGTYATGQATTGTGIRPAPYSTDFNINPYTYGDVSDVNNISQPHGVGFVFATALWDMTWALVDYYGGTPDPDFQNGTGGNNVAMTLVMEALKLQPCSPGMIDGRDAILQADQLLYGGEHQCVIWEAFANRGFGYSADQGSSFSRADQVEAFDLPNSCLTPTIAPTAAFEASSLFGCNPTISFEDNSTDIPQSWEWDFGDGSTSTDQNPTHTYAAQGTYTVQLTASNPIGSDVTTQSITIQLPDSPTVSDAVVCYDGTAELSATATGTARWYDNSNALVFEGSPFSIQNVTSSQTFSVENVEADALGNVGPANPNIGSGGYHSSTYFGAINFTADQGFEIVSAWIDADGAGPRTFLLGTGTNLSGNPPGQPVDQVTVNLVDGLQQVELNITVPEAGTYHFGGNNVDLYRNDGGANYPYTLANVMTITGSSASTNPTGYYYYFYDLELREIPCISAPVNVTVTPVTADFSFTENNGTLTFTDLSTNATSWSWDFGDGNTSTDQNPTHFYSQNGSYTVTLEVDGLSACTAQYSVNPLGVDDLSSEQLQMSLIPNPTRSNTTIQFSSGLNEDAMLSVYSSDGRLLNESTLQKGTQSAVLSVNELSQGLYWIVLNGNEGTQLREKLMVVK